MHSSSDDGSWPLILDRFLAKLLPKEAECGRYVMWSRVNCLCTADQADNRGR